MNLMVDEIFRSIQGETTTAGFVSLFIRLAGCNLACSYCDTPGARQGGRRMTLDAIMDVIQGAEPFHHVTVTGGEPLMQRNTPELLERLVSPGHDVQLETNGSLSLAEVPPAVRKIVDVKTPSSGHEGSFLTQNLTCMTGRDELKFVISHRADFFFAADFLERHGGSFAGQVNCSPVFGVMDPAELAGLMLSSGMRARLNLQLHRYIWGPGEEGKIVLFK